MPPKSAQKTKVKKEVTPPPTPKPKPKPASTPSSSAKKPKKDVTVYRDLPKDTTAVIPVDVSFEGTSANGKLEKSGNFTHTLKLNASSAFTLTKTFMLQGGDYDGMQAILIRPAKAFNFKGLSEEVQARIYRHYFAPHGVVGAPIVLEGKRKSNNEVYAKLYADGSKNRIGLLTVDKEIYAKALPIFYANNLSFENTTTLMEFLANIKDSRPLLTSVTIKHWVKITAKTAMGILAESPRMTTLRIENGVFNEGDPTKAAKLFYDHAYKFMEAVSAAKRDTAAGVNVLSFGKQAFKYKDEKKVEKPWSNQQVEEFKDLLKEKMSSLKLPPPPPPPAPVKALAPAPARAPALAPVIASSPAPSTAEATTAETETVQAAIKEETAIKEEDADEEAAAGSPASSEEAAQ